MSRDYQDYSKDAAKDPNVTVDPVTGIKTSVDPATGVVTETDPVTKKDTVTDPSRPGYTPAYLHALAAALQPYLANLAPIRAPKIDTVTPTSGVAGEAVAIVGSGFAGCSVALSGVPANDVVVTDTRITFTVPSGAPNGAITVRRGPLVATSGTFVTGFVQTNAPLSVTGMSPETGIAGSLVNITGTGLSGVRTVMVGDTPAKFVTHSDSLISVTVPPNSESGAITVDNGTYSAESASFDVIAPARPAVSPAAPKVQAPTKDDQGQLRDAEGRPVNPDGTLVGGAMGNTPIPGSYSSSPVANEGNQPAVPAGTPIGGDVHGVNADGGEGGSKPSNV